MATNQNNRIKLNPPKFDANNYEGYVAEVTVCQKLCGVPKAEQGILLWYNLPSDHSSDIKTKIYNEVGVTDLSKEDGVERFINAMNDAFKPEDKVKAYDVFVEFFVDMKRKPEEKTVLRHRKEVKTCPKAPTPKVIKQYTGNLSGY